MGSGKSSLGRQLAREMKREFIDLDKYIEERFHATIRQIFDWHGETEFRKIERNIIHEVAEFENIIIACGGGTPCQSVGNFRAFVRSRSQAPLFAPSAAFVEIVGTRA